MKASTALQAKFDKLVDDFNNLHRNGDIDRLVDITTDLDNLNYEVGKCVIPFLRAKFDANQITKMLSGKDVLKYHCLLKAYGASPKFLKRRLLDLLYDLLCDCEWDYIREHLGEFYRYGVGFTTLMECFRWAYPQPSREYLLMQGIDEETINKFAKRYHL